jgi:predicted protein tyrosine phosphatase
MFIPPLQRHLSVCAQIDLPRIGRMDPGFWHVISIREPQRPLPDFTPFRSSHSVICYDIVGTEGLEPEELTLAPNKSHQAGIFNYVDERPGEPILVHCWAGQSRSTAVALTLIVRGMHLDGYTDDELVEDAVSALLAIRPCAAPNPLMLLLGLQEFLVDHDAQRLAGKLLNQPELFANHHKGASPGD